jgi:4-hydroxy-2-oxoheptanedioate aldolase
MIMACESRMVSPVVRVSGINESEILKALDIGAHCVQIPNACDRTGIESIIKMSKYPPAGNRGFSPFTRAGNYDGMNARQLTENSNANTLVAAHIEGKDAVNNIDEILAVKNLDIIFVGLFDLSKSLGIAGDVENSRVIELLKIIINKTIKAGKYTGTIVTNEEQLKRFIGLGAKYITYSVDCEMLKKSYLQIANIFRGI